MGHRRQRQPFVRVVRPTDQPVGLTGPADVLDADHAGGHGVFPVAPGRHGKRFTGVEMAFDFVVTGLAFRRADAAAFAVYPVQAAQLGEAAVTQCRGGAVRQLGPRAVEAVTQHRVRAGALAGTGRTAATIAGLPSNVIAVQHVPFLPPPFTLSRADQSRIRPSRASFARSALITRMIRCASASETR